MVKDRGRIDEEFLGVSLGLLGSTTIVLVDPDELGGETYVDTLVGRRWGNFWWGLLQVS